MIKYFYFEHHFADDTYLIKNEKILYDRTETNNGGISYKLISKNVYGWYFDIEKYINNIGPLDIEEQNTLDKLLIQQRNKKLDTL